jgi:signal transduction histidine kinase
VSVDRQSSRPSWRALASCRRHLRTAIAILDRAADAPDQAADDRGRALAELWAAERELDAFVAAAVHALRTSATAIKGQAQLLRSQADRQSLDEDHLAAGLARMEAVADDVVDVLDALVAVAERPLPEAGRPAAPGEPGEPGEAEAEEPVEDEG